MNKNMVFSTSSKQSSNFLKIISPSLITPIQKEIQHSKLPQHTSTSLCNFLIVYFNCCYYLCCCPFRLITDTHGLTFKITGIFPQKVICAVLNSLGIIIMFTELRKLLPFLEDEITPYRYFQICTNLFILIFQVLGLKRFWMNETEFLAILNFIANKSHILPSGHLKIQHKNFSWLICFLFSSMALYQVLSKVILAPFPTWNSEGIIWNRNLVSQAHYLFFLTNLTESQITNIPIEQLTILDYSLTFFVAIGWVERYILGFFIDLALFFSACTIWSATYLFAEQLEQDLKFTHQSCQWKRSSYLQTGSQSISSSCSSRSRNGSYEKLKWPEVYKKYNTIKQLCTLVNKAFGTMTTIYTANSLLYYSMGMDSVLVTNDPVIKAKLAFFFCNSACMFILAADACNQLDILKKWLMVDDNRHGIPMDQLNMVIQELQHRVVGMRGNNIFTITYPVLWHMLTAVVTYFIICLQTRKHDPIHSDEMFDPENCTFLVDI